MLISQKQLKKVTVETQSGQFLGYVVGFELETDSGIIEKYHVGPKNLISGIWQGKLIINRAQVVNFNSETMVVEDNVVKIKSDRIRQLVNVKKLNRSESIVTSELENR